MKHTFKFDTIMWTEGDLYYIRVSARLLGHIYETTTCLSFEDLKAAKFDTIGFYIKETEQKMELHLAKISSS